MRPAATAAAACAIRGATACRPACAAVRRRNRRAAGSSCLPSLPVRKARNSSSVNGFGAVAQLDEGFGGLAAVIVGNADHDHFLHGRMGVDRLLDHLRIDVEAAGDDHVLLAVDQIEIAVGVHVADVAGEEAVADKGFRGFLRPVPVALGDVRAADADFADFARPASPWSGRPATPRPSRCRAASARSSRACPALPSDGRCRASRSRSCPSRSSASCRPCARGSLRPRPAAARRRSRR